jgi:hypothetical protein
MSTLLNRLNVDEPQFRHDLDRLAKGARLASAKPTSGNANAMHTDMR